MVTRVGGMRAHGIYGEHLQAMPWERRVAGHDFGAQIYDCAR